MKACTPAPATKLEYGPRRRTVLRILFLGFSIFSVAGYVSAQTDSSVKRLPELRRPQDIIVDTDIGGDIDDAYAIGLALESPEVKILGIMTDFRYTTLRARLVSRFLMAAGRSDIPVAAGVSKYKSGGTLTQARYAERGPLGEVYPDAVDFMLKQIRMHPGEITLICIGPETNIGAAIDRDPATFRELKRVILMGGSVYRGYNLSGYIQNDTPSPEYNIAADVNAAQKLFTSGVPLFVMPVDSTQIKLEELRRARIFSAGTPLTDALTLLTEEWSGGLPKTPTLYDAMAVAYALNPALCPATAMRLRVEGNGNTKPMAGPPNAEVCLHSDQDQFFDFFMPRIVSPIRQVPLH